MNRVVKIKNIAVLNRKNIKKDSFILFLRNKIVNPSEDFLIPIDLDIYEVRFKLLGGKVKYLLLF